MGIIPDKYISELSKGIKKKWAAHQDKPMKGLAALSPLLVFLCIYLASSIIAQDFYKIPISAAFLIASIYAVATTRGKSLEERITTFSKGAGNKNVLLMIWIFVLAGAFAATAKEIGAIDATVNLALRILPGKMLYAGLFLAACFISMAIGTSVGTIVALVPVAAGIAQELAAAGAEGIAASVPFITAIIVGGAFFGDNLSFISDTTIAATRTQGCSMADKFKMNIRIAGPAALIVAVLYIFMGKSGAAIPASAPIDWVLLIPYILVIVLAVSGIDVSVVLTIGLVVNAVIGFAGGGLTWSGYLESIGSGISGMGDLIIVTVLAGGMLELIKENGLDVEYAIVSEAGASVWSAQEEARKEFLSWDESDERRWFNWYKFNCNEWGCKWNSSACDSIETETTLRLIFDTPWGPPYNIIGKLIQNHPELKISGGYMEEGMGIYGSYNYKNYQED